MPDKETNEEPLNEEPMELVKMCGPTEAEMIEEMLENNGIDCTLQGEVAAMTWPTTGMDGVRIWVKRDDAESAHELVDAFFTSAKDDVDDVGEKTGPDDPEETTS